MKHCACKNHFRAMPPSNRLLHTAEVLISGVSEFCLDCLEITTHVLPRPERAIDLSHIRNRVCCRATCLKDWECNWCESNILKGTPYVEVPCEDLYYPKPSLRFHTNCFVEYTCIKDTLFRNSDRMANKSQLRNLLFSTVRLNDFQVAAITNMSDVRPSRKLFSIDVMEYYRRFKSATTTYY